MTTHLNMIPLNFQFFIPLPKQFDFQTNLNYLNKRHDNVLYNINNHCITRLININNEKALVQISEHNKHKLSVNIVLSTTTQIDETVPLIKNFITDWFDLNRDLTPFYHMAKQDPILNDIVKTHYGLRNIGIPDLFEALCWAILGQQINLTFAATLKRQFVESFGHYVSYNDKTYWSFPSYETIASITKEHMSHIKMTDRKREYIIGIAEAMNSEKLTKEKLLSINDPKNIEKELTKLHGVGPWTAQYVLMRCLRYPTIFPITDAGLINAIQYVKNLNNKPSKHDILTFFERWNNWESYVTFYLWETLY